MKVCITCGRNNCNGKKVVWEGAQCVECYDLNPVIEGSVVVGGFRNKCSGCGVVLNEKNGYARKGGDFNGYCRVCTSRRYKEKKLKNIKLNESRISE